jgi:hypothetical protein
MMRILLPDSKSFWSPLFCSTCLYHARFRHCPGSVLAWSSGASLSGSWGRASRPCNPASIGSALLLVVQGCDVCLGVVVQEYVVEDLDEGHVESESLPPLNAEHVLQLKQLGLL